MKRPRYITVPEHVRAINVGPATVIVNYRNGRAETLIGPAARWWDEATTSGYAEVPGVLDGLAEQTLCRQLLEAGLISPTFSRRPGQHTASGPPWVPSWGTQEMTAGRGEPVRVPFGVTARAGVALAVVLGVLGAGRKRRRMARLVWLLTWIARRSTGSATADQARLAINAVRRAGLVVPGRVACLEESAAVAVMLALSRQRVTWCHGAAADPVRLHAWVETDDGHRVAEPPSTARFAVLRAIPERDNGGENDA
ncbi:lasso peptide biosynthesis B2 protein [Streptomyces sp. JJ66]|uniref:lasso peptide biosynthesis B2 protein n=1 Tax=Streptomyces sp. JJ66 TaxID=2803843 RepID=UPI001C5627C3|nr:lasso peptide biosynthesis B2 protein [Streptomyces sp. JJ66]MBW1604755.1 lasso peptide biosynthesis B2 protein [Streptomyces sp. JJ66]